jgi:hypothetical protein
MDAMSCSACQIGPSASYFCALPGCFPDWLYAWLVKGVGKAAQWWQHCWHCTQDARRQLLDDKQKLERQLAECMQNARQLETANGHLLAKNEQLELQLADLRRKTQPEEHSCFQGEALLYLCSLSNTTHSRVTCLQ